MRKISLALAFIASLLALPAQAANFSAKDAAAATIVFTNPGNCTTGCTPIFAWSDSTGANLVAVLTAGADGASNTANGGLTYARNLVFNGTTWDRWQGAVTNAGTFAVQLTGATNNINNIAGTISLPTGAATSANQSTEITALNSIVTNTAAAIPAGTATIGNVINAPTSSSSLALTAVSCGSAVSSCVLKASAGNFYGAYAECTSACWLMVFNSTTAPANGATTAGTASGNLVECISLTGTAGGGKSINYPTIPVAYSVGITAAISSTACATLTLSTVGFVRGSVL